MTLDFDHIFTGVRVRCGHEGQQNLIKVQPITGIGYEAVVYAARGERVIGPAGLPNGSRLASKECAGDIDGPTS
jgi:hypothetical protein